MATSTGTVITCNWTRLQLLRRANGWLATRGWTPLTEPTLAKWVRAGIVPPPRARARGYGRGTARDWSWLAYRRILQVARLREQGLTSHRDQRVALWLAGANLDIGRVRSDLRSIWERETKRVNREVRRTAWGLAATSLSLSARGDLERLVRPAVRSLSASALGSAVTPGEVTELLIGFGWHIIVADSRPLRAALEALASQLPADLGDLLAIDEDFLDSVGGLMADPVEFDNPLAEALTVADDVTLSNIRDWVLALDDFCDGAIGCSCALILRGDILPSLTQTERVGLAAALRTLRQLRPFRSAAGKLLAFALFLRRPGNTRDDARPLAEAARAGIGTVLRSIARGIEGAPADTPVSGLDGSLEIASFPERTRAWLARQTTDRRQQSRWGPAPDGGSAPAEIRPSAHVGRSTPDRQRLRLHGKPPTPNMTGAM